MAEKIPVTVVVPVRNEAANLPLCLGRLTRFERVVVVDSGSDDGTPDIARRYGAELVDFQWDGRYPKKRNWMLLHYAFPTDWALFLDADEVVDDAFCEEIKRELRDGRHVGYWLRYTNYFLGKKLKHGLPQRKLAFFRVDAGLYERIDEQAWSALDMEVHEHPVITGSVGEIRTEIAHRDYRGLGRFLERHLEYARWEARRLLALESAGSTAAAALTRRQRFKYANLRRWWYPWFYFVFAYLMRLGFLDGGAGFHYALYKSYYFQTVRLLLREYGDASTPDQAGAARDTHSRVRAS